MKNKCCLSTWSVTQETCFRELKKVATSEEFATQGFDIRTYLFLSYLQRINCEKRPQPKSWKLTLVSGNKISKLWAFLLSNLAKWDEILTGWNLRLTARFCLQTVIEADPYFKRWFQKAALECRNATLECKRTISESSFRVEKAVL